LFTLLNTLSLLLPYAVDAVFLVAISLSPVKKREKKLRVHICILIHTEKALKEKSINNAIKWPEKPLFSHVLLNEYLL